MRKMPFDLKLNELATTDNENSLAFTLALQNELTSIEKIGDNYKLLIQIDAQLLFFNYNTMTIAASYPVRIQLTDVKSSFPSEDAIQKRYRKVLLESTSINLFEEATKTLSTINLQSSYANTIQVVNSNISDKAFELASDKSIQYRRYLTEYFAQSFSQALSTNQSISVLPYIKGHAVGNKLAGRYANGGVYSLDVPEPDYAIDLNVMAFKRQLYSEEVAGKSYIYASQAEFRFYEPFTNKTYFQEKLFNGATKVIPASQTSIDHWPAYQESLLVLFDKVTFQLDKPNKKWLKKHSGNHNNFNAFKSLKRIIEKCR
jgi:hypothetical protein